MGKASGTQQPARRGFGRWGWWTILFIGMCYYMMTGSSADGLNVTVPAFSEQKGWDYSTLLSYSTISGIAGMVVAFFTSALIKRRGAKFVIVLALFVAGGTLILHGYSSSMGMYLVTLCFANSFAYVYSFQATGPLIASWFPKKRGIVMGYATAAMPLASATYLYLLNWLIKLLGLSGGIAVTGGITLAIGVIGLVSIKNTPEEVGMAPDNDPASAEEVERLRAAGEAYQSPWTVRRLLANKTVWLIALAYGLMMMANTGVISQLVPRITIDKGHSTETALLMFSTASVCGIFFSGAWGWLDNKIGTKRASHVMLIWFILSVAFNLVPGSDFTLWLSIVFIGGDLGGTANFLVSMTTRVFGRRDFEAAYGVIYPIFSVIRTSAFAFVGLFTSRVNNLFGGQQYAGAYLGIIGLCVVSFVFVSLIDYNTYLGHDEEAGHLAAKG